MRDLLEHAERLRSKALEYEREIRLSVRDNELARRAQTRQGIGSLTASALVATVGNGHDFQNGRQFAAWLGLVPRQYSTGGKTRLGHKEETQTGTAHRALQVRPALAEPDQLLSGNRCLTIEARACALHAGPSADVHLRRR